MGQRAQVTSLEALQIFREKLCEFGSDAREILGTVDIELRRCTDWLQEQMRFWQREILRRQDQVSQARVALHRKRMSKTFGRNPDLTEEERAYRRAKRLQQHAEEQVAKLRRWAPMLQHAIQEYRGPARQLDDFLEASLKTALARLDRKSEALEQYVRMTPPTGRVAAGGATSDNSAGTASSDTKSSAPENANDPTAKGESH